MFSYTYILNVTLIERNEFKQEWSKHDEQKTKISARKKKSNIISTAQHADEHGRDSQAVIRPFI